MEKLDMDSTCIMPPNYVQQPNYAFGEFETAGQVTEDLREHVEQAYALLDDDAI
jgi:hypothetical protein